jgi:hypothetical protein
MAVLISLQKGANAVHDPTLLSQWRVQLAIRISTLQQHVTENRHSAQSTDHYPSPAPHLQGISPRGKIVGFLRRRVTLRGWTTKLTEGK